MRRKRYYILPQRYPCHDGSRLCECGCGKVVTANRRFVSGHNLRGELAKPPLHAKVGDVFGWLTVLRRAPNQVHSKHGKLRAWLCQCQCGTIKIIADRYLFLGYYTSCGCRNLTRIAQGLRLRHGMSSSREYEVWASMRQRVKSTDPEERRWYLDRGIKVCERYQIFENFYADLGNRPSNSHSLDRINNDLHYSCGKCNECHVNNWPLNVRWATRREQALNKRITKHATINGITKPWAEWCAVIGISTSRARRRVERDGWPIERALTTPPQQRRVVKC